MTTYSSDHARLARPRATDPYIYDTTTRLERPEVVVVDTTTVDDALTWTGILEALDKDDQSHAKPRTAVPVWSLAAILWGCVLMALGWMFNDQVARWLWTMVQS